MWKVEVKKKKKKSLKSKNNANLGILQKSRKPYTNIISYKQYNLSQGYLVS